MVHPEYENQMGIICRWRRTCVFRQLEIWNLFVRRLSTTHIRMLSSSMYRDVCCHIYVKYIHGLLLFRTQICSLGLHYPRAFQFKNDIDAYRAVTLAILISKSTNYHLKCRKPIEMRQKDRSFSKTWPQANFFRYPGKDWTDDINFKITIPFFHHWLLKRVPQWSHLAQTPHTKNYHYPPISANKTPSAPVPGQRPHPPTLYHPPEHRLQLFGNKKGALNLTAAVAERAGKNPRNFLQRGAPTPGGLVPRPQPGGSGGLNRDLVPASAKDPACSLDFSFLKRRAGFGKVEVQGGGPRQERTLGR